ncbi:hypothetical protein IWX90DRAFT_43444 [Phyllosticta citrichinensis]|uniref:CCHC-type domain-containing protein n=1 Tax=Phyllosticta citrichinensis TaxID=1130410 RepID=A0ABR1Y8B5_9PEZI
MSWEPAPAGEWQADSGGDNATWGGQGESNGFGTGDAGDLGGDAGGAEDVECHNCKQTGHFARDCTEEKQFTGECYNCGEVG